MAIRGLFVVLMGAGLLLGGCMEATLSPSTNANFTSRDKKLLAAVPYTKTTVPRHFQRHIVDFQRKEQPGTIVVDTGNRFLYYVLPGGKAIRYGVAVGEDGKDFSGVAKVGALKEWPGWTPTANERAELDVPAYVPGGPANPLGSRAIYLFQNGRDTLYRIHGTNQPEYIGQAISFGCIRMTNEDVIDLYKKVKVGSVVVVLKGQKNYSPTPFNVASRGGLF